MAEFAMSSNYTCILSSPLGEWAAIADADTLLGLYSSAYKDFEEFKSRAIDASEHQIFNQLRQEMNAYFSGDLRSFTVTCTPHGTPFQQSVWDLLIQIPYGETRTYGELAKELGNANASRAVGLANGQNPISIIIPCHRVIGSNGSLTGYAGGLPMKLKLLELEGVKLKETHKVEPVTQPLSLFDMAET